MSTSRKIVTPTIVSGPLSPFATSEPLFEACERRLVLSAQLMFDVLGDQALELHQEIALVPHSDAIPIESHLKEAHAASGWNAMQQQFGLTGKGQTVAVIDSGIAWDHVALGKGFGPGYRVVAGWDFTEENDANPYDDGPLGFHGTHVAGIIGSDNPQHSGVAPEADLVALRVFNDLGQGQLSWVERALQWVHDNRNALEHPITTVNLSLGTAWNADGIPNWATLEDELKTLVSDGIVVTASAGNSFQQYLTTGLSYPAASPYVLPVASVDDNGQLSEFSQRNDRVIAAPGRNIFSTVPDHVLGRDGKIDDFTLASGTSMAAPYVAGASVLVRQAMEMVGYAGINLDSIAHHLHSTADNVFDAVTGANYDRLNLQQAIDSLLPDDQTGDLATDAAPLSLGNSRLEGWINTLDDQDVYRFTPDSSGTLHLHSQSNWLDTLQWSLNSSAGTTITSGGLGATDIPISAGQSYFLVVTAGHEIGSFQFDVGFTGNSDGAGSAGAGSQPPTAGNVANLGPVHYLAQSMEAGSHVRVQAVQDGLYTVQWTNHDAPLGSLSITRPGASDVSDASWSAGSVRLDVQVNAGQWLDIRLPGAAGDQGELVLANAVAQTGSNLFVRGGTTSDNIAVDLTAGLDLRFGEIEYIYPAGAIHHVTIDAHAGNDRLSVIGSPAADKVDLRPTGSTIENAHTQLIISAVEEISYNSGGGRDRVYLYDSNGDDTLTARPRSAELVGVGYRFAVEQTDRIYIHATGSGQDYAYLYDSAGNDRLSVRPQFSSMTGENFFNYVRGFERVYAYANAGGTDQAELYDSPGEDRFATSGASASIVGPGFSSFTRSFEQVNAYADSGGVDWATLYGAGSKTVWQQGSDFVSFREDGFMREARGFANVQTFVAGHAQVPTGLGLDTVVTIPGSPNAVLSVEGYPPAVAPTNTHAPGVFTEQSVAELVSHELNETDAQTPQTLQPLQTLRELRQMSDWLSERVLLSEETLLVDPEAELCLLDEIFSRHYD